MTTVSAKEFVKIWQQAEDVEEVLKKTGLNRNAAHQRAYYYRRKGVPLKKFRIGRQKSDVDELKKLAEEYYPEDDDAIYGG